ncbi:MAG: DUF362 domain-containing protein [Archaeoglobaceae archaeon]|nr:DUF362 domain-containing protein [Archaeoglobaceae archaeon]MCX8151640.1 DUF362 domain-containing protein [Archaeoglobaceae archaeon]MDW8013082.1 DUF362 domain-containing protein [Archaeoglobaceae archaeon]
MEKVYFTDVRAEVTEPEKWFQPELSAVNKLKRLLDSSGILDSILPGDLVAVKTHFGDLGTTRTLRSVFIRTVVEKIKEVGGKPFVTETTGLGLTRPRCTAIGRLLIAETNGYTQQTLAAPIVIADGLLGFDFVKTDVDGKHLKSVYVAKAIAEADVVVCCTHFKLHMVAGIGGSIKNVGVGCVAKPSKFDIHAQGYPKINDKCIKCDECVKLCPVKAIEDYRIVEERCLKCLGCEEVCRYGAIDVSWLPGKIISERIAECAKGVLSVNKNFVYINFLLDISPHCDCHPYSDVPVVRDVGILTSKDLVAIDLASVELYEKESKIGFIPDEKYWPWTDPHRMIEYAEELGIGKRSYRIIEIE